VEEEIDVRQFRTLASARRFVVVVAATSVITLAASSPNATPSGGADVQADCSTATALRVAKEFLWTPLLSKPIGQVLCGRFTGAGSEAMAVTFNAPTCWSPQGWAVFQFTDGDWRLVLVRRGVFLAGPLVAVGADIRETTPVFLPRDTTRCNPTGGTRARIWHWNGSQFTAGAWKQVKPPVKKPTAPPRAKDGYFKTPSGNIICYHSPGPVDRPVAFLGCGVKTGLKPAPPRRPCENGGYAGDRVELFATGRTRVPPCAGDPGPFTGYVVGARVLGYGKTWSGGGLSCRSEFKGLTCRNRSGHGFFLSRTRWRAF
jgi:hypothetical protein